MQGPGIYAWQAGAAQNIVAETSAPGIAAFAGSCYMIHRTTTQMDVAVAAHLSGAGDPFGLARK